MVKLRETFLHERQIVWGSPHWHKNGLKILESVTLLWTIFLLQNDYFSILIPENDEFKLHLKESLLIKSDKPELNRNIHTHPFELFT